MVHAVGATGVSVLHLAAAAYFGGHRFLYGFRIMYVSMHLIAIYICTVYGNIMNDTLTCHPVQHLCSQPNVFYISAWMMVILILILVIHWRIYIQRD